MPFAPSPAAATASPLRVLLAVTGLTPQVLTETLFALMREAPSALPHEVHLVTTGEGAARAQLALLSEHPGWFYRFLRDFGLPPIDFRAEHIHVLRDRGGAPLVDIRSADDNALAADQIAEKVRALTADENSSLHVSLAGGRKTLGFFAGYALSLWGRAQDRLSHVLVGEPFEQSWDFFYPTPYERIIETRDRKLADCAQAEVTLADIPFVRLRHGLPRRLLDGHTGFAEAVRAAQTRLDPPRLTIDRSVRCIDAGGTTIRLAPAELAFLAWFARRALQGLPPLACPSDGVPSVEHAQAYLAEYGRLTSVLDARDRTLARYRDGMHKADFEERKSKLKKTLEDALGAAATPYLVQGEGRKPMRYRLRLPAQAIRFVD